MPYFYFHVRSGDRLVKDPDGGELPDLATAQFIALAAVRAACAELARRGKAADAQRCEISDGAGRVLATAALRDAARPH